MSRGHADKIKIKKKTKKRRRPCTSTRAGTYQPPALHGIIGTRLEPIVAVVVLRCNKQNKERGVSGCCSVGERQRGKKADAGRERDIYREGHPGVHKNDWVSCGFWFRDKWMDDWIKYARLAQLSTPVTDRKMVGDTHKFSRIDR